MAKFVNKKRNLSNTAISTSSYDQTDTLVETALSALTTDKGHVLIGCNVANIHSATVTVDVALVDEGTPDVVTYIAKAVSIPVGGNVELVDGKIVIDSDTTQIHATCSVNTGADIIVSILENA
tara:strand:+ start:1054 stop:1422 length:369 start_codon:yes stop_codon:yes gene_type:complete